MVKSNAFTGGTVANLTVDGPISATTGTFTGDILQTWAAAGDTFVGSRFSTTYELGMHALPDFRELRLTGKAGDSTGKITMYTGLTPTLGFTLDNAQAATFSSYVKTQSTTVAGLTAAGTAGASARSFVTDATATTFSSIVAGDGVNGVPVYSDGTNWRIG
jgi:hypothetical protein